MIEPMLYLILGILLLFFLWQIHQKKKYQSDLKNLSRQLSEITKNRTSQKIMLFTDTQEIKILIGQLNDILEDRQKIRAEFIKSQDASKKMLSNISHDIKTPLTVILGYLELLTGESSSQTSNLLKIQKKSQQLYQLVDEFFQLSKLESGDANLKISVQDICELCRQTLLDFYEILTKQSFEVDLIIPETPIFVSADPDAVKRILSNLVTNVLRYGADGNYLGFFIREEEASVFLEVIDHGKGIPAKALPYIFDRLYVMEDSRNPTSGGSGLGLAISKALALEMKGDLEVSSIPNQKTSFLLKLKRAAQ